jgi:hypothetical protein
MPHGKPSVYTLAFSNKIMSAIIIIISSILIIFGYSEAYGQTMANTTATGGGGSTDGSVDSGTNGTRSDIIDCLVNTCINPNFQLPSNTSVIAMAFVNLTLTDIQDYKEVLKSEVSEHINDTIDSLATGLGGSNFSICAPSEYRFELPCPLINGIAISPQNLTLIEQLSTPPVLANTTESFIRIEDARTIVDLDQNQLEARFTTGGPIPTNGSEGAFGYGILTDDGDAILVTTTHAGVLDSEEQNSIEDPTWHNHFISLGNVEQCGEDQGVIDITWQSPGEVTIDDNNATINQIPTNGFEGRDSITDEPLSMMLGVDVSNVVSFRLNPVLGEDGLLEAVCVSDITPAEWTQIGASGRIQ